MACLLLGAKPEGGWEGGEVVGSCMGVSIVDVVVGES